MRFDGKVALVTGGGSGIGQATAQAFAREGAKVAIVDQNEEAARQTAAAIERDGGTATALKADVSVADQVESAVQATVAAFGGLDIAFNNAGGGRGDTLTEMTEEVWDASQGLNLKGVWLCLKFQAREMIKAGRGAIINVSSSSVIASFKGNNAAYVSSKTGVLGLTKHAAIELAEHNIRVNAILPGVIATPLSQRSVGVDLDVVARHYQLIQRAGRPEEVARAVLFLASDEASFITGVQLPVDGGACAL